MIKTFRPSRLEKREKSVLYDQNVTIRLKEGDDDDEEEDEEESIRLGLMLNSALKVHGIVEGSPLWKNILVYSPMLLHPSHDYHYIETIALKIGFPGKLLILNNFYVLCIGNYDYNYNVWLDHVLIVLYVNV